MDDFDDEIDAEVNDIISQIKNQSKNLKRVDTEKVPLKKEDMEEFILKNASAIVQDAVELVGELKSEMMTGADPKLLEAYSILVKSATSAIDSLTKLKLSEDKLRGQKEIAQMNIDSKQTSSKDQPDGFLLSREEVIAALMEKSRKTLENKAIDI
jgi:hypothetical protein